MEFESIDEEEQQKLFVQYLKKEKFIFKRIKDGYDLDDEFKINFESDFYSLIYSGPDFALRYSIQYKKEDRKKLKLIAKEYNEDKNFGSISYYEDDSYDDFYIFVPLLFNNSNDIEKYFKNYLCIMQCIKNYIYREINSE